MSPAEQAVDRLSATRSRREAKAIFATAPAGFTDAAVERAIQLVGSKPSYALHLTIHWPLFLEHGENVGQSYRLRGIHERLHGRWQASARAFVAAGDHDPVYSLGAIDAYARSGRVRHAVNYGDRLAASFNERGDTVLAGKALLNTANALTWADCYGEAQERYSQAIKLLSGAESAYAKLGLSSVLLYLGEFKQADREAEAAISASTKLGLEHTAFLARINQAHARQHLGRPDVSIDLLGGLRAQLADEPTEQVRVWEFLGDALYRLNLWTEAADAYREALRMRKFGTPANTANCELGLALCDLAAGKLSQASEGFKNAHTRYKRISATAWQSAALTGLAESIAADYPHEARRHARQAMRLANASRAPHHEALACLTVAELEQDSAALQRAQQLIDRHGLIGLAWRPHALKAAVAGQPLPHYRRMLKAMLRARVLQQSTSARSTFLRDKEAAIRGYMAALLDKPSSRNIEEAVQVVSQIRSASLIDEIVASRSGSFTVEQASQLQALRSELSSVAVDRPIDRSSRARSGSLHQNLNAVDVIVQSKGLFNLTVPAETGLFVQLNSTLALLRNQTFQSIASTPAKLEDQLRWLKFELMAPMANRKEPEAKALDMLHRLATSLLPLGEPPSIICPDGMLFGVPWAALGLLLNGPEPVVALHPAFHLNHSVLNPSPRAALWIDPSADLPYATREAEAFLEAFPAAAVFRSAAEVRSSFIDGYDHLHVLCHGSHNVRNPMFSSLRFSDGEISARELAASGLRLEHANVAACSSGMLSAISSHEPDGLVRGFLACGAQSVIASAWPLDDEAGLLLSKTLFNGTRRGLHVRDALRAARIELRTHFPHPYFWGCSTLFGGYSA